MSERKPVRTKVKETPHRPWVIHAATMFFHAFPVCFWGCVGFKMLQGRKVSGIAALLSGVFQVTSAAFALQGPYEDDQDSSLQKARGTSGVNTIRACHNYTEQVRTSIKSICKTRGCLSDRVETSSTSWLLFKHQRGGSSIQQLAAD